MTPGFKTVSNAVGEHVGNMRHAAALGRRKLSCRRRPAVAVA
jgi:hypothetical protein